MNFQETGNPKVDFDLLGWARSGSPGAFASAKNRQQYVTFQSKLLGSPHDHSKTSSKKNAKLAWLVFHVRILSGSEGPGGPVNCKPDNLSKVHWWMLCEERNIWPRYATAHEGNQKPPKNQEVEMHPGLKMPNLPGEKLSLQSPKSEILGWV